MFFFINFGQNCIFGLYDKTRYFKQLHFIQIVSKYSKTTFSWLSRHVVCFTVSILYFTRSFAIIIEEISSCCVSFFIIKYSKYESYLYNTNIWGHFWSKYWYLNLQDTHTLSYQLPHTVLQLELNKYQSCYVPNV